MKTLPLIIGLAGTLALAHAANYTVSATADTTNWNDGSTWENGTAPTTSADIVYISNNKSVELSNSNLTIRNMVLGAYTNSAGTGNLTLNNAQLTLGALTTGRLNDATGQSTGVSTIKVINNSHLNLTNSSNLGYYDAVTQDDPAQRQQFSVIVDGTSSFSAKLFNVGRGTVATLSLEAALLPISRAR